MNTKIAIISLRYVGLPLVHAFSEKYEVVGFDINTSRIDELNNAYDRTLELDEKQMKEALQGGMKFTNDLNAISDCAERTIKTMIANDKRIKDSNVLILGVTFKEDCPDMRNTKVVDVIEELKTYGCNIDVYDPWVDPEEEKHHYKHGIIQDPFKSDKKYDSIVVAVAHKQFIELSENDYENISNGTAVLMDIKGIVPNPSWRL